jgi:hypothetical protein
MPRTLGRLILILTAVLILSTLLVAQAALAGGVTGSIVARFDGNPVALPDIKVTLVNRKTGLATGPMMTDLNGPFGFSPLPAASRQNRVPQKH